jgi:hypothetical protein
MLILSYLRQILGSHALIQKWGLGHYVKSLWDLKSEIGSLHFSDFTLVKIISE